MKSGQAATGLIMAFGIIVILILVIVFLVMVQDNAAKGKFSNVESKVDNQIILLNYLRTPFDPDNTIADLIVKYKMTNDADTKKNIEMRSKQIFGAFEGKFNWKIRLDGEELMRLKDKCAKIQSVSQEIILFDGKKAKVELICE